MSSSSVRVRFAPSPTGYLHIGGARTALFNWLWARQKGGTFILRIEDTDRERSTEASTQAIVDSMRWLGLDWDEGPHKGGPHGPYFQMQRLAIYQTYAERLIGAGRAYRCYCTKDELAAAREAHAKSGSKDAFRYPGTCRNRTDRPEQPYVVRFKAPAQGATGWTDLVKGRIDVPNDAQQDFVVMRSDGVPLYNFGAVVDDIEMKVTLVARGDDHVVNTPQQILMYEALGERVPQFAHLPMILAQNGEKLSKRHAAVSALEYRDKGFLPDAVLNYLARLGWSHGDQEIFTRDELVAKFDWEHCGRTGAKYDLKKFEYVQASHLRAKSTSELAALVEPYLAARGVANPPPGKLEAAIRTVVSRAVTLVDIADMVTFYFAEPLPIDEDARTKFLTSERAPVLQKFSDVIEGLDAFDEANLETAVTTWLERENLKLKDVAQPARAALTGRSQSPGLYEVMVVLGQAESLKRLRRGVELARS